MARKVLGGLCFGLLWMALGVGDAYGGAEAVAWRAQSEVVIDGSLEEWVRSSPIYINKMEQAILGGYMWGGSTDCSATVYLMWDELYLYIGAELADDVPFTARPGFRPDEADSLGIYISTNPNANPDRAAYEPTDFRILLMIDGFDFYTALDRDMVKDPKGLETGGMYGDEHVLEGYQAAVVQTARNRFTFEAKVPWASLANAQLPKLVPQAEMQVSFNVEINDIDMPCPGIGAKSLAWVGTTNIRTNPKEWGVLIFKVAGE